MNVMVTMNDIITQVEQSFDPEDLVLILEITSEDIVDRFPDKVQEHFYKFKDEFPELDPDRYEYLVVDIQEIADGC